MARIAIFGASSRIARDFIANIIRYSNHDCFLFGRSLLSLENITENIKNFPIYLYDDFSSQESFDLVLNFIGSGDPKKTLEIGESILEFTKFFDEKILDYLSINSHCVYIFISSGSVYNTDFLKPAGNDNDFEIELSKKNWYVLSKQLAELKHRSLSNLKIVDLRIFNYISSNIDIDARFLISDILRSVIKNQIFYTSKINIYRDYVSDIDIYYLIDALMYSEKLTNCSIDVRSSSPIGKFEMLETLQKLFKLQYKLTNQFQGVDSTVIKKYYYSHREYPEFLDFKPRFNSIENVINAFKKILETNH